MVIYDNYTLTTVAQLTEVDTGLTGRLSVAAYGAIATDAGNAFIGI